MRMQMVIITVAVALIALGIFTMGRAGQNRAITAPDATDETEQTENGSLDSKGDILDLHGTQLQQVPTYVFDRRDVVNLDLSHNELTGALPAEIRFLSKLKVLDLSNNAFTGVPAEVGQLSQLEVLNLSHNQLTGLPHELGNLKNLKSLDLRGNSPSAFDLEIIRESLPNTTFLLE